VDEPARDETGCGQRRGDDREGGHADVEARRREHLEHERDEPGADEERDAAVGGVRQGAAAAQGRREDAIADGGEHEVQDDDAGDETHQAERRRIT
jgi:hypothetical protein